MFTIHDFGTVIDQLAGAHNIPVSVIIVGIGNDDFTKMQKLDNDENQLRDSNGNKLKRD